jgi:hypothetical protein
MNSSDAYCPKCGLKLPATKRLHTCPKVKGKQK